MADSPVLAAFILLYTILNVPLPGPVIDNLTTLVTYATTTLSTEDQAQDALTNPNPLLGQQSFDFIIVGGGSAGLIVANRLSLNFTVLVIEAGGNPTALHRTPGNHPQNLNHNETDWIFKTEVHNDTAQACKDNRTHLNHGKLLGGSSELNFLMYQRGNPRCFNNWGNLTGDAGWNFDGVLPYFKKLENYTGAYPNATYHGTDGPIHISSQNYNGTMINTWMAAGNEKGYGNTDPNAVQNSTFAPIEYLIKNGERCESYEGYLEPILNRSTLTIVRYARVIKVNINNTTKVAESVTYTRLGQNVTAIAKKEVILSAGSINTPQILMLSGVGNATHLSSVGIPVVADRPGVGSNLQDHPLTLMGPFFYNETNISFVPTRDITPASAVEYQVNRTGPFATPTANGAGMALISTTGQPEWPNVMVIHGPLGYYNGWARDFATYFNLKADVMEGYMNGSAESDGSAIVISLVRPKSRGTVRLGSDNPYVQPLVDLNFYSHPDDMAAMVAGLRFFVEIFENTTAFQKYNATLINNKLPGCESHDLRSDAYYECWLRHITGTQWHPSGTAKMGLVNDTMAVVDSSLRVIGVHGLRCIDGSIMPNLTNANTYTPIAMIGEKGSDLILSDYI